MGGPVVHAQLGGQPQQQYYLTGYAAPSVPDYSLQGQALQLQPAPPAQQPPAAPMSIEQAVAAGLAAAQMVRSQMVNPQQPLGQPPMQPVLHNALQRSLDELRLRQPSLQAALTDEEGLRQLAGLGRQQQHTVIMWLQDMNVQGGPEQQVPADWLRRLCAEAQRH
jgi:hypothetical protein